MKKILIVALMLSVIACKKNNSGDNTKPSISLSSPAANQQFAGFSTVTIAGTVVDDDKVNEVHVIVTNKGTNAEVLHIHEVVNAPSYTINGSFTAQPSTSYKIHVEADDKSANSTVVEIEVKAN